MYIYDYENALLIKNRIAPALTQANLMTQIWAYDHNIGKRDSPAATDVQITNIIQTIIDAHKQSETIPALIRSPGTATLAAGTFSPSLTPPTPLFSNT